MVGIRFPHWLQIILQFFSGVYLFSNLLDTGNKSKKRLEPK